MRIAFTIVLNGEHHLTHNNFWRNMLENFDYWVIVEGVALPNGSTSWCKTIPDSMHKNYLSTDYTTTRLSFLNMDSDGKVSVVRKGEINNRQPFTSKDEQVNAAINFIKTNRASECFLWQVDVDEQWTKQQLDEAEEMLVKNGGKTGCFLCDYYVGPNQQVFGDWGEGKHEPYRRLWNWKGEMFLKHEPPTLEGKNGPGLLLPQRFKHYAYYFEQDVKFKEAYYQGYEGLYERWLKVQENRSTIPVKELLGPKTWWSFTNSHIKYVG